MSLHLIILQSIIKLIKGEKMQITDKFNKAIKILDRIAITIILGSIALTIVGLCIFAVYDHFKHKPELDEIKVKTTTIQNNVKGKKEELILKIGDVVKIRSANLFIANVEESKGDSVKSEYYRGSASLIRNLLLISENADKTHLLFNTYTNKIKSFEALPDSSDAKVLVCWFYKNYDADKDDSDQKISLMLIKPDGSNQTVIVEDIDRLLTVELDKNNHLEVIYFKAGKLMNVKYSTVDFKLAQPAAVFDLANSRLNLEQIN